MSDAAIDTLAAVDRLVRSRGFQDACDDFFDKWAPDFEDADIHGENRLVWTDIHRKYEHLVEDELNDAVGERRIEELCDELPTIIKDQASGEFAEAILLLTNFSDFLLFKQMMVARSQGDKQEVFGKLNGLGEDEDLGQMQGQSGMEHLEKLMGDSKKMYRVSNAEGWKEVVNNDTFTFSVLKGFEGDKDQYMKAVMLLNLSPQDNVNLWCKFGPSRDKWDKVFMTDTNVVKDYNEGKDTDDYNALVEGKCIFVPKLMRWAMGMKDPMGMRIITQRLEHGAIAYVSVGWDTKTDAPDKKMEYSESGIIKPHPDDPNSSYLISVSKMGSWTPPWLMGKLMDTMMSKTAPVLAEAYRKEYYR